VKPYRITVHCAASADGKRRDISDIRRDHLARGFHDVGYHLVIQPDGEIQRGRSLTDDGAHVEGANQGNIGICLPGTSHFTRSQLIVLRDQIMALGQIYDIPLWEVRCHYQFPSAIKQGKTCPNMEIGRLLSWLITGDLKAVEPYLMESA
jgi:N-acetylmuramoyl-L-alanine amidase